MKFMCPKCRKDFEAPRPDSGHSVACALCGHVFVDLEATALDESGPVLSGGVAPGKVLGGFLIEERAGTGAMGVVYKARQLSLDRTVALKVLPPAFANKTALVRRFHEETAVLSTLNHPNIVTIIDRGNVGKVYFFVMEYIDGPSLHVIMSKPVSLEQFLKIAKGTAEALHYAHERGVVHRDIKPSNIMLNSLTEVKIADFGLAGLMAQREEKDQPKGRARPARMGTPAYMSPEQRRDPLKVDGRTDIYAAGIVFHELVAGERPEVPLVRMPSQLCQTADPRLDQIIAKCLEEDPDKRYQTAGELLADLEAFEVELTRAPRCPACHRLGPVRSETCVHCGQDLSEQFDICPECRKKNRREVRRCLYCGTDLEKGRTLISNKVAMMLEQADRFRLSGEYEEAVQILDEVQSIEGKAFEEQRDRAQTLREKTLEERQEAAKRSYAEARKLVAEHRFREAIDLYEAVPQDLIDTTRAVRAAKQIQERMAAERRAKATTNLILLGLGLLMILVILFVVRSLH